MRARRWRWWCYYTQWWDAPAQPRAAQGTIMPVASSLSSPSSASSSGILIFDQRGRVHHHHPQRFISLSPLKVSQDARGLSDGLRELLHQVWELLPPPQRPGHTPQLLTPGQCGGGAVLREHGGGGAPLQQFGWVFSLTGLCFICFMSQLMKIRGDSWIFAK